MSKAIAATFGLDHGPDILRRPKATIRQDGMGREARFVNVHGAITMAPRRAARIGGRPILLIDDVMTSGATLTAASDTLLAAGAGVVHILTLARVAKDA